MNRRKTITFLIIISLLISQFSVSFAEIIQGKDQSKELSTERTNQKVSFDIMDALGESSGITDGTEIKTTDSIYNNSIEDMNADSVIRTTLDSGLLIEYDSNGNKTGEIDGSDIGSIVTIQMSHARIPTAEEWVYTVADYWGWDKKDPSVQSLISETIESMKNEPGVTAIAGVEILDFAYEIEGVIMYDSETQEKYIEFRVPEEYKEFFPESGTFITSKITIQGYDENGNPVIYEFDYGEKGLLPMLHTNMIAYGNTPPPEPDPTPSKVYAYVNKSYTTYEHMEPSRTGSISNPNYDVSIAIPTSEYLNFSTTADDSLYYIKERKQTGVAGVSDIDLSVYAYYDYACTHTNDSGEILHPDGHIGSVSDIVLYDHSDEYRKTYYDVPTSNIYPIQSSSIYGAPVSATYSMTGGPTAAAKRITVTASKPNLGDVYSYYAGHYDNYSEAYEAVHSSSSLSSAKSSLHSYLKRCISWQGREFTYSYRGLVVTKDSSNKVTPSIVKTTGGRTNQDVIPSTSQNGNYSTSGRVVYAGIGNVFGFDPNDVFIHTPVVNEIEIGSINTTPFINQKVTLDSSLKYLMLDEDFTISIPREGSHINAKGYQTRAYNSYQAVPAGITNWGKIKDVKFPFDVYLHVGEEKIIIPADTWLSDLELATAQESYTFTIPVWAEEGGEIIETRVVAENATGYEKGSEFDMNLIMETANTDYTKYVSSKEVPVEIIGKIYDLRISATNDPGWTDIKGKEGAYITAAEFPFGQSGQNKLSAYKFAPKLGYTVEFDFKTKGIKTDNVDVSIEPEGFYFVGKSGGTAEEVDLYYKTTANRYVKIQTGVSNSPIIVNLANKFMKVATSEVLDSQRIMKKTIEVAYTYTENVNIGSMPSLNLPEKLRLCYNNFAEYVDKLYKKNEAGIIADAAGRFEYTDKGYNKVTNGRDTVIAAVGHWYAGYRLPSSTIAVPKGTTATQILSTPDLIKKGGYILVKFDIVGKSGDEDYLRYTGPESINEETNDNTGEYVKDEDENEMKWQDPTGNPDPTSPTQDITLPNGSTAIVPDGATIMFETDLRANNDYESEGTH